MTLTSLVFSFCPLKGVYELLPRVELGTSSLPRMRSTTELKQQRAKDGTQTRDPQLGRLVLYRLSYFRKSEAFLQRSAYDKALVQRSFLVGADGFEPPKSRDSRFTVCPIWPLWNTPSFQSSLFKVHYFFACARASSRTRTNDRWITNLVLYQLSYRGKSINDLTIYDLRFCSTERRLCNPSERKSVQKYCFFLT